MQVSLVGSFTHWVKPVGMIPVEGSPGVFSVVVQLAPGYHQYKFIVDGVWRHDEKAPFMPDPNGNVNNWVFVRKPEPAAVEFDRNYLLQQGHFLQELQNQITEQLRARATRSEDVPMTDDIPHLLTQRKEPEYTLSVIHDFLHTHTAFELIPESGKVVVLDIDLSIRQAFHALHEQGIPSAALWDGRARSIVGVISASDFIQALKELRESVRGSNPLTAVYLPGSFSWKSSGRPSHRLVYVRPDTPLEEVVKTLIEKGCSMAPIVTTDNDRNIPSVLHTATLDGVVACLVRHFQASISSLPFLSRPLSVLNIGTWSPTVVFAEGSDDDRSRRRREELKVIHPETSLMDAFDLLLQADVSALPVVNTDGALIDVYAREDITHLAKNCAYTRLLQEDMTVHQALLFSREPAPIPESLSTGRAVGGLTASFRGISRGSGHLWSSLSLRAHSITRNDTLRSVVERLAHPGVHRLMVIDAATHVLKGIISLTDVATYLFIDGQKQTIELGRPLTTQ